MDIVGTLSDVAGVFLLLTKENVVIGDVPTGMSPRCGVATRFQFITDISSGVLQRDAQRCAAAFENIGATSGSFQPGCYELENPRLREANAKWEGETNFLTREKH